MVWLIICAVTLILLGIGVVTYFLRVSCHIHVLQANLHTNGELQVKLLRGLLKKTWDVPAIRFDEKNLSFVYVEDETKLFSKRKQKKVKEETPRDIENRLKDSKELIEGISHLGTILRKFLATVQVEQWKWATTFGTGDAAATGIAAGVAWTLKAFMLQLVSSYTQLRERPHFQVTPFYQAPVFYMDVRCIVTFQIGHAIRALLKMWMHSKKLQKTSSRNERTEHVTKGA